MLLKALRHLNIKKKTHNKLREKEQFVEVDFKVETSSILILVEKNKSKNLKEVLTNVFDFPLQNIQILEYCNKLKKEDAVGGQFSFDDFGWFGKIKNTYIEKLVLSNCDLLLNYSVGNIYMDYLTSMSNAKFKVGYFNSDSRLYDLMIDVKEPNIPIFNSELKKYLKILKK